MQLTLKRSWTAWLLMPLLFSCATYNKSMDGYYAGLRAHDYSKAQQSIEHNKLIKKSRNALLFNLEMGRLYRLQNDPTSSNIYLNRADDIMEANSKSLADIALGNLINPMHAVYRGEDFEQFMMHYYKALNYAALGKRDDAVVEARRITLAADAQHQKFKNAEARYSGDAFSLNLQGMIYEMAGDINNAFISYRNAAEIYEKGNDQYYGVHMPLQLRSDLVRTSGLMGFGAEQQQYEKLFNVSYRDTSASNDELVLFIEEGEAPVKEEKDFFLTTGKNGIGSFVYSDATGYSADFNFNYNYYGVSQEKLTDIRALRVTMPAYRVQYPQRQSIDVTTNGVSYTAQLAEDLNNIALNVLKERFVTELANALARQLTKKLAEKGTQAATEAVAKSTEKKDDKDADDAKKEEEKKKREAHAKEAGEAAGFLMNIVNTATEKADTRGWQSLPAFVSYVRLPLQAGENVITLNSATGPITLKVPGGKGLQMMSLVL